MIADRPRHPPAERPRDPTGDPGAALVRDGVWGELALRARAEYPREACGFLVGPAPRSSPTGPVIDGLLPTANVAATPEGTFESSPEASRRADEMTSKAGRVVVGAYHTHPDTPSVPSRLDRERAWPGYLQLIVSIRTDGGWDGRLFAIDADSGRWSEIARRGPEARSPPGPEARPRG
jgi:desampylase